MGTKCDCKSDVRLTLQLARYGQAPITRSQGHRLARRIGAITYVETSALTQHDLKEAFDEAIVSALGLKRNNNATAAADVPKRKKRSPFWRKFLCCYIDRLPPPWIISNYYYCWMVVFFCFQSWVKKKNMNVIYVYKFRFVVIFLW